jgi:hypothetical protein
MLTLNGFASEEGSAAVNDAIVKARVDAVAGELKAQGHDAAKLTRVPKASSGKGRLDYRRMRSVEILQPGQSSFVPPPGTPSGVPCAGSNETDFKEAESEGEAMIDKSVSALGAAPIPATMTALLTQLFMGWTPNDAGTIKSNLTSIKVQMGRLLPPTNHQCGTLKFGPCDSGSYAVNFQSGSAAVMTMCPRFFASSNTKKERGGMLLHEAAHGTPGLTTKDKAYAHERLIKFLTLADALKNTDHYRLLVRLFDTPGSMTFGEKTADVFTGMSAGEQSAARLSIAWLEEWLTWSSQEMGSLYDQIRESIAARKWTNAFYQKIMSHVAPLFGLTPPPAVPTNSDRPRQSTLDPRSSPIPRGDSSVAC